MGKRQALQPGWLQEGCGRVPIKARSGCSLEVVNPDLCLEVRETQGSERPHGPICSWGRAGPSWPYCVFMNGHAIWDLNVGVWTVCWFYFSKSANGFQFFKVPYI